MEKNDEEKDSPEEIYEPDNVIRRIQGVDLKVWTSLPQNIHQLYDTALKNNIDVHTLE